MSEQPVPSWVTGQKVLLSETFFLKTLDAAAADQSGHWGVPTTPEGKIVSVDGDYALVDLPSRDGRLCRVAVHQSELTPL